MDGVNALIRERMASEHAPRIPEVTAHLVEAGGKRLRPLLTLAAARLCGYEGEHHLRLAATVEFIHTATLLHDDVVDESARRRGRPTANLLWDNKSSVLVGDYLFARAFQLMVETGDAPGARHPGQRLGGDRRGRGAAAQRRPRTSRPARRPTCRWSAARPRRCSPRRPRSAG